MGTRFVSVLFKSPFASLITRFILEWYQNILFLKWFSTKFLLKITKKPYERYHRNIMKIWELAKTFFGENILLYVHQMLRSISIVPHVVQDWQYFIKNDKGVILWFTYNMLKEVPNVFCIGGQLHWDKNQLVSAVINLITKISSAHLSSLAPVQILRT